MSPRSPQPPARARGRAPTRTTNVPTNVPTTVATTVAASTALMVVALSLLPGLGCGGSAPPAVSALQRIRDRGTLRWGGDQQGGEPYVFEDPKRPGTLVGFEVEIAQSLAHHLGARAEFVQNDWSTLIPSLERGTFDIALNGIEVTGALMGRVAFSRPYFAFTERLVARDDDGRVTDLESLRGRRVGALAATQAWHTLERAGAIAVAYEGVEEPLVDLETGRVDAVLLDDIIVDRYAPRHPRLRIVGDVGEGRYAIALRPADADLRAAIDDGLASLVTSGELRHILDRWGIDGPWQARLALADLDDAPVPAPQAGVDGKAGAGHSADASASRPAHDAAPPRQGDRPPRFGVHHFVLFLRGAAMTLIVSFGGMTIAVLLGLGLALCRLYLPRARLIATAYIELFRGTPVLLQLYVLYYGLAPVLRVDAMTAAIIGLGLNYAAYEAEIYRAGISAVPPGQLEAALSLGMTRGLALRRIVLPQALRFALPGITNDFIALLKDSSLVSVITVVELTKRMSISAVDTGGWLFPGIACAALYFAMSYPLSRLARHLEGRLTPGPRA